MSILRKIVCDICGAVNDEVEPAAGFPGWAGIHGVVLDGAPDPNLCPPCLVQVMEFIEKRKAGVSVMYIDRSGEGGVPYHGVD